MNYLNLIRYKNLFLIAFVQVLIKYSLFTSFKIETALTNFNFALLVMATLCIAAAGNIINDIYDVDIDRINKPKRVLIGKSISEKNANYLFIILNVIGVGIGFYLANTVGKANFAVLFVIISSLLYIYASYLKAVLIIGNILVSVLVAMSLIIVVVFDILPILSPEISDLYSPVYKIVFDYALFAFFLNFIREIVKDILDVNGDKNGEIKSLPIVLGKSRTIKIVFVLGIIAVATVTYYMYINLYTNQIASFYFLFFIIGPLLLFCIKTWSAKTNKEIQFLSIWLKICMFFGMCSLLLYPFILLK